LLFNKPFSSQKVANQPQEIQRCKHILTEAAKHQ